jgi:DNA-binding NarL/FixJ family response regulator
VVLTTSKADNDLVKAYDYHVNSYVVKPVDFEKFSQLMNDLGFYWLAWNQKP